MSSFLTNLLIALRPVSGPLALPPVPADFTEPLILCSCAPLSQKCVEPAGIAFQTLCSSRASKSGVAGAGARKAKSAATEIVEDDGEMGEEEKKKLLLLMGSEDHYAMLGLGHLNINATDEQIKKSYRRMVLRYHPDKQSGPDGAAVEKTDPLFLAIQKAYDVLSNEKTRRAFDSQYHFDESIPSGTETFTTEAEFFDTYGPVFERNSRWSSVKPVPMLGSPDDDDDEVTAFYNFWFAFQTWRDFSNSAEHRPEEAESREERRWMERENEKSIAKLKRAEVQRIYDLAQRAYNRDPRIARIKKREEDAKHAAREAKLQAKRAAEEEQRRLAEEKAAKEAAEEEARRQEAAAKKLAKEKEKKAVKKAKSDIVKLFETSDSVDAELKVDLLAASSAWDSNALAELCATLQSLSVDAAIAKLDEVVAAEKAAKTAASTAAATAAASNLSAKPKREWSVAEVASLAKGVAKFPPGTKNRWVMIADYVSGCGHGDPRSADECITKSRAMGEEDKKKANQHAFESFVAARGKEPDIKDKDAPVPVVRVSYAADNAATTAAATTPTVSVAAAATDAKTDSWTAAQQSALEKALRTYPATMEKNERWSAIAAAVGKSKKECIERFKEIREKVLASKATA